MLAQTNFRRSQGTKSQVLHPTEALIFFMTPLDGLALQEYSLLRQLLLCWQSKSVQLLLLTPLQPFECCQDQTLAFSALVKFCRWPESSTECWARRGSVRPGTGATTASTSRGPETSRNTGLASSPAGPTVATEPPTKKLFRNFYFCQRCLFLVPQNFCKKCFPLLLLSVS